MGKPFLQRQNRCTIAEPLLRVLVLLILCDFSCPLQIRLDALQFRLSILPLLRTTLLSLVLLPLTSFPFSPAQRSSGVNLLFLLILSALLFQFPRTHQGQSFCLLSSPLLALGN